MTEQRISVFVKFRISGFFNILDKTSQLPDRCLQDFPEQIRFPALTADRFGNRLDYICSLGDTKFFFRIDVKRPPEHNNWECSITFNGKDMSASENADMCLFLEEFNENREEYASYQHTAKSYQNWKDKTLAYYSTIPLSEKEQEELSEEERIKRRNAILNKQFGE